MTSLKTDLLMIYGMTGRRFGEDGKSVDVPDAAICLIVILIGREYDLVVWVEHSVGRAVG